MKYYKENQKLPKIPDYLIDDLDTIKLRNNIFQNKKIEHLYRSYLPSRNLKQFLQNYFEQPINVRYQLILGQLPIHVDSGALSIKYNFLLLTGGDVKTRWWDNLADPKEIVYQCQVPAYTWHELKVDSPHDISIPSSPRLSVEIHIPTKQEFLDEMPD